MTAEMTRLAVGAALLMACGESTTPPEPDAGADPGICPAVGGLRACGPRCDQSCTNPAAELCPVDLGLCVPMPEDLGWDDCYVDDESEANNYCYQDEWFCAATGTPGSLGARGGFCVPRGVCDAPPEDMPFECFFSDRTDYVSPPPFTGECLGHPDAAFCGGGCGGCDPVARTPRDWRFCVGINADRGVGGDFARNLSGLPKHLPDHRVPRQRLEHHPIGRGANPDIGGTFALSWHANRSSPRSKPTWSGPSIRPTGKAPPTRFSGSLPRVGT